MPRLDNDCEPPERPECRERSAPEKIVLEKSDAEKPDAEKPDAEKPDAEKVGAEKVGREADNTKESNDRSDSMEFNDYGVGSLNGDSQSETDSGFASTTGVETEHSGTETESTEQQPNELIPTESGQANDGSGESSQSSKGQPQQIVLFDGNENTDQVGVTQKRDCFGNESITCKTPDTKEGGITHPVPRDVVKGKGTCQRGDGETTMQTDFTTADGWHATQETTQKNNGDAVTKFQVTDGNGNVVKKGLAKRQGDGSLYISDSGKTEFSSNTVSGKAYDFEYQPDGGGKDASRQEKDVSWNQQPDYQAEKSYSNSNPDPVKSSKPNQYESQEQPNSDPKQYRSERDEFPGNNNTHPQMPASSKPDPVNAGESNGYGISGWGHTTLDILGMIPLLGEPIDVFNAGWYAFEGDMFNASLSMTAAMAPIGGQLATGGRLTTKAASTVKRSQGWKRLNRRGKPMDAKSTYNSKEGKSLSNKDNIIARFGKGHLDLPSVSQSKSTIRSRIRGILSQNQSKRRHKAKTQMLLNTLNRNLKSKFSNREYKALRRSIENSLKNDF